jgi:hypothetical protein
VDVVDNAIRDATVNPARDTGPSVGAHGDPRIWSRVSDLDDDVRGVTFADNGGDDEARSQDVLDELV